MPKVLLVDDDPILLQSLGIFLREMLGVSSIMAGGLAEVEAKEAGILAGGVRLAILDINLGMEQPDGFAIYRWLRDHHFPGKIVFLTGHAKGQLPEQDAQFGKDVEVFAKPLPVDILTTLVEQGVGC